MTEVQLVEDGPNRYSAGGLMFEPGEAHDVSEELAEHLLEKPFFVAGAAAPTVGDADEAGDGDAESFDADAWLNRDYGDRADAVAAGEVDAHLGEIDEVETSDTVRDAIGERRAELEG